ncbi:MAG: S8 family serine peptidase [Candidatus Cloacimonetes bacterium]|nr:S8 family serine peptidase [Candidatus Cloacimonadota bacterium]
MTKKANFKFIFLFNLMLIITIFSTILQGVENNHDFLNDWRIQYGTTDNYKLDDIYPGRITVCFSADLIGNTRGMLEITHENGIVRTPYDWFNELADEYQIVNLTRKYRVKNTEWNLDGKYPMNVFRIESNDHSRTNELLNILKIENNVLFAELEGIASFGDITHRSGDFQSPTTTHRSGDFQSPTTTNRSGDFQSPTTTNRSGDFQSPTMANNFTPNWKVQDTEKLLHIPNDPELHFQWAFTNAQVFETWAMQTGSPEIIIGIVDSGIKWNHPDLAANIWINEAELPGITINWENGSITGGDCPGADTHIEGVICPGDNDGNGFCDDVMGWDFWSTHPNGGESNNPFQNLNGSAHGTHVAGCAAAVGNNSIGVAGPAFTTKLLNTKHSPFNYFTNGIFEPYAGIYYMVDTGVHLINCSWGGYYFEEEANLAATYAKDHGVLMITSAGNTYLNETTFPAAADDAFAVVATTITDTKVAFSTYGDWVDISAPGVDILSTAFNTIGEDTYLFASGTSMASPIVAGIAALVKSQNQNMSIDDLIYFLQAGADPIDHLNPSISGLLGAGRVNALNSVSMALSLQNDLATINIEGPELVLQNTLISYTISVRNFGLNSASGYTVNLMKEGELTPLSSSVGVPLLPGDSHDFTLEYIPNNSGQFQIYGEIIWNIDENPNNNKTKSQRFTVTPYELEEIYVGDPNSTVFHNHTFIHYWQVRGITQTIYYEDELTTGTIYQVTLRFNCVNSSNVLTKIRGDMVRLYMATTEQAVFENNNDWIPFELFSLVYYGELDIYSVGTYDVNIVLSTPFEYNGGNLVLMALRDDRPGAGGNFFQFTNTPGVYRNIHWGALVGNMPISINPYPTADGRVDGFTNARFFILGDGFYPPTNLEAVLEDGAVNLSWEAPAESEYASFEYFNVYKNGIIMSDTINFFFIDEDIEEGIEYNYWVTAVYSEPDGESVSSNVVTIKIPIETPPGAVVLISPENNTVEVELRQVFTWELPTEGGEIEGLRFYIDIHHHVVSELASVLVGNNPKTHRGKLWHYVEAANHILLPPDTTEYTLEIDLEYATTYYWQVIAFNEYGDSKENQVFSFTTRGIEVEPTPEPVVLLTPENEAVDVELRPVFTWELPTEGGEIEGLRLYIDIHHHVVPELASVLVGNNPKTHRGKLWHYKEAANHILLPPDTTEYTLEIDLEYATTYYWQVIVFNEYGDSENNQIFYFTTKDVDVEPPPNPVVLLTPVNETEEVELRPVFTWELPTEGAEITGLRFYISSVQSFVSNDNFRFNSVGNALVRSVMSIGMIDATKAERKIASPTILPADTAEYTLEIDLEYATTYIWQVIAFNEYGDSENNQIFYFTTKDVDVEPAPNPVALLTPVNEAVDVELRPVFTWELPTEGAEITGLRFYIDIHHHVVSELASVLVGNNPKTHRGKLWHYMEVANHILLPPDTTEYTLEIDLEYATTYYWQVVAFNEHGDSKENQIFSFTTIKFVSDIDDTILPSQTELVGNYPNPFNPETTIHFNLANNSRVVIDIFNVRGQLVIPLLNENLTAGYHNVRWNGTDYMGSSVSTGIYFYRMTTDYIVQTKRMVLMK